MLYYDNKISQLESLAKEIKTTLETIQTSLTKSAIQNTLNDNFESLKNETLQELLESSTQKQNEILTLIETKKAELESANAEKIAQSVEKIASETITDLIDLEKITQNIVLNIENNKSAEISAEVANRVNIDTIAQNAQESVNKEAILNKAIEKIKVDLQNLALEIYQNEQTAYFRDLIRKTEIYASQNMLAVSNALFLAENNILAQIESDFEKIIEAKTRDVMNNITGATFKNLVVVR